MEKIIQAAFARFKKSFLRYFLVYVLGILGFSLSVLAILATAGVSFLLYLLLGKSLVAAIILGVFFGLSTLALIIYLSTWFQLSQVMAITKPELKDVYDCFRQSQNLVLPFLGFSILHSLFLMGFFLSNILVFLPFLIWSVWGIFAVYAFLDGKRGGLKPLWFSKARVSGHFFKVLLYFAVVYAALFLTSSLFVQINENLSFLNALIWFVATPLIMSYSYEIYLSLPEPKEAKPSTIGIIFSVIGWGLNLLVIALVLASGVNNLQKLMKNNREWQNNKSFEQNLLKEIRGSKLN
jgi:hypothetical protein